MASTGDKDGTPCPISRCADLICGKWTVLVIRELTDGPRYFSDLESGLQGISPRTLCERLKFLTENDVVSRTYIKALQPPRGEGSDSFWAAADHARESAMWRYAEIDTNHMIANNKPQELTHLLLELA